MNTRLLTLTLALGVLFGGSVAEAQLLRVSPRVRVTSPILRTGAPIRPLTTRRLTAAPTTTSPSATRAVTPAPAPGRVGCRVEENGAYAPASIRILDRGRVVASGDCDGALEVPAGTYEAVLTLETALDRPTRSVRVTVPPGGRVTASAAFATSILEVRFTADGRPATGIAYLRKDGRIIGTLGSGVSARVSAGRYEIVARYRTEDRVYTVDLAPGQRRAVRATF